MTVISLEELAKPYCMLKLSEETDAAQVESFERNLSAYCVSFDGGACAIGWN